MVLVTHHIQSSYAATPLRTLSWKRGIRLKENVVQFQMIPQTYRFGTHRIHGAKGKSLQISCFKGNVGNNEVGDSSNKFMLNKNSVKISFVQHDREETLTESPTAQDMPVCGASDSNTIRSRSQAFRGLFMKWLNLLHSAAQGQSEDDGLEGSLKMDHHLEQHAENKKERGEILKVVLCYFLGLDATIMIPLLIFVPLYLGINVVYGAEVSRELTPLWIIGPLVIALYVKLFRWIVALYVFSFRQTVKVAKNLPTYCSLASNYIAEGKLKEDIRARLWQPVVNIKNLGYKELSKRGWKVFQEWLLERYLDFVDSIWPYYCRTIRFLKGANLI